MGSSVFDDDLVISRTKGEDESSDGMDGWMIVHKSARSMGSESIEKARRHEELSNDEGEIEIRRCHHRPHTEVEVSKGKNAHSFLVFFLFRCFFPTIQAANANTWMRGISEMGRMHTDWVSYRLLLPITSHRAAPHHTTPIRVASDMLTNIMSRDESERHVGFGVLTKCNAM